MAQTDGGRERDADEQRPHPPRASIAQPHRERAFAGTTVSVGMSRRLLATRMAEANAPDPDRTGEPGET
jgi:hypothetical protein